MVEVKNVSLLLVLIVLALNCDGLIQEGEDQTVELTDEPILGDASNEKLGAYITQIIKKPFAASLQLTGSYVCSAVILNNHWVMTATDCFDPAEIKNYVFDTKVKNYTVRVGSSYNNKGGIEYKVKSLVNNFDYKISLLKLKDPLVFGPRIKPVEVPDAHAEPNLGRISTMMAWTPTGHIRAVNAPIIESNVCDLYTNLFPGQYLCVGGVQDPNRKFCRRDNGGAVIQNNTLIALTMFLRPCAVYMKLHAFPKISKITKWLHSIIWDEGKNPKDVQEEQAAIAREKTTTQAPTERPYRQEENQRDKFKSQEITDDMMMSLNDIDPGTVMMPYNAVNVPLEPTLANNNVVPGMSLYESYLQNKLQTNNNYVKSAELPHYPHHTHTKKPKAKQNHVKKQGKIRNEDVDIKKFVDYDYTMQ